jgi:hypothetical protein
MEDPFFSDFIDDVMFAAELKGEPPNETHITSIQKHASLYRRMNPQGAIAGHKIDPDEQAPKQAFRLPHENRSDGSFRPRMIAGCEGASANSCLPPSASSFKRNFRMPGDLGESQSARRTMVRS